jgi:hypothetical protein
MALCRMMNGREGPPFVNVSPQDKYLREEIWHVSGPNHVPFLRLWLRVLLAGE